jgi:hypothetical protein
LTGQVTLKSGTINLADQTTSCAIEVQNGSLVGGSAYSTASGITVKSAESAAITLTGITSDKIGDVSLASGSTLKFYSSGTTTGDLDLSSSNVSIVLGGAQVVEVANGSETATAMIDSKTLTLTASKTTLDISNQAIVNVLTSTKKNDNTAKIALTTGSLEFTDNYKGLLSSSMSLLSDLGLSVSDIDGGSLVLSGSVQDVYLVTPDQNATYSSTVSGYTSLDAYKAVVLVYQALRSMCSMRGQALPLLFWTTPRSNNHRRQMPP